MLIPCSPTSVYISYFSRVHGVTDRLAKTIFVCKSKYGPLSVIFVDTLDGFVVDFRRHNASGRSHYAWRSCSIAAVHFTAVATSECNYL